MREKHLEDLLFHHPYLIDAEFADIAPRRLRRQVGRDGSRLDLAFDLPSGLCLVELKITRLNALDVAQLNRYCRVWSKTDKLAPHHYLIGKRPLAESGFKNSAAAAEYDVRLLYLGEDLPRQLVYDEQTRRYRAPKNGETTQSLLELKFG